MRKVIITTGGTGGHIYPALALAKLLREKDIEVIFIGSKYRMEKDIIPNNGYKFYGLPVKPLGKASGVFRMARSIIEAGKILKNERPEAIIGFGNYISVAAIIAALGKKINIYLHEQNIEIGSANKFLANFAKKVFLTFDKTFENIPVKNQGKFVVTGNPIREEFFSIDRNREREKLKIEKDEKMVLILGGSLGAKSINDAVLRNWEQFFERKKVRVYLSTGVKHFDEVNEKIKKLKPNDIIKPYFENMASLMSAADLIVCRAGASTITELIEMEKPAIFIPYNFVGQYNNAMILKDVDGAMIFKDNDVDNAIDTMFKIIEDKKLLQDMSNNLRKLKKGRATEKILQELDIWRN